MTDEDLPTPGPTGPVPTWPGFEALRDAVERSTSAERAPQNFINGRDNPLEIQLRRTLAEAPGVRQHPETVGFG